MKKTHKPIGWYLFAAVFGLIGVIAVVTGILETTAGIASYGYAATEGTILSSGVSVKDNHHVSSLSSRNATSSEIYRFSVQYRYEVGGKAFMGDRYDTSNASKSSADVSGMVVKYPAGTSVRVYYDAGDPSRSMLKTGPSFTVLLDFVFGAVFLLVAWVLWVVMRQAAIRQRRP